MFWSIVEGLVLSGSLVFGALDALLAVSNAEALHNACQSTMCREKKLKIRILKVCLKKTQCHNFKTTWKEGF